MESMTGVAVVTDGLNEFSWTWTLRSVNGKSFDVRCRLPYGCDALDATIREILRKYFARGTFTVSLDVTTNTSLQPSLKINEQMLDDLCVLSARYAEKFKHVGVSFDGLLNITGVMEKSETFLPDMNALAGSFEKAALDLKKSRLAEGEKIKACLKNQLEQIDSLAKDAEKIAAATPDILTEKLKTQIASVSQLSGVSEERLAQEVALLLIKSDIREETDRLQAHVQTGCALLDGKAPCGKKLDFLCQELNRESNTLCSKAADISLTNIGLTLKSVIDQFREQVQNIE